MQLRLSLVTRQPIENRKSRTPPRMPHTSTVTRTAITLNSPVSDLQGRSGFHHADRRDTSRTGSAGRNLLGNPQPHLHQLVPRLMAIDVTSLTPLTSHRHTYPPPRRARHSRQAPHPILRRLHPRDLARSRSRYPWGHSMLDRQYRSEQIRSQVRTGFGVPVLYRRMSECNHGGCYGPVSFSLSDPGPLQGLVFRASAKPRRSLFSWENLAQLSVCL